MNHPFIANERGSIFLTTLIMIFLMTLVGGYMYQLTSSDLSLVHRMEVSAQAQQVADAGLAKALSIIKASWAARTNSANFPLTTLSPGTYQTTVSTVGTRTLVATVGTVQGVQRTASAEMAAPVTSVLDYAMAASSVGFTLTGGSSVVTDGNIYADTTINLNAQAGASIVTTGNLDEGGTTSPMTSGAGTITVGTATPSAPLATYPTIDFNYYQNIAQNQGGTYINGNVTYSSPNSMPSPAGHVIFVNGDVTISKDQTTTAAIIATGSITVTGGTLTVTPPSTNYPALITRDGSITIIGTGNSEPPGLNATGLVYSGNNFTISGNHHSITVTGVIIARGSLTGNYSGAAQNDVTVNYVRPNIGGMTNGASIAATIRSYNR